MKPSTLNFRSPSISEIKDYGEDNYFTLITALCSLPDSNSKELIKWFYWVMKCIEPGKTNILLGDLKPYDVVFCETCDDTQEKVLYWEENDLALNTDTIKKFQKDLYAANFLWLDYYLNDRNSTMPKILH